MWIWLLAVFLIIGTWLGGYFLEWPLWLKILLTVLSVLMVVGWLVARRLRASMKARALERELLKQAEQQALNARPDRRAEILELQVQMQRGLEALKQSRLGSGGRGSALYTLPWYMIIGPPGAGKTTALKQSGLVFPYLDPRSGGGIRGVGGTRNCDWWFTNEKPSPGQPYLSPRNRCLMNNRYCTGSEWLSPRFTFTWWINSGVGSFPANSTGRPVTSVWKLTSAATLVREIEVMTGGLAAVAAGLAAVTAGLAAGLGLGLTGLVLLFEVGMGTSPSVGPSTKGDPPGATYAGKNHPL